MTGQPGERWDSTIPPGGWVCATCGIPTESEPCPHHMMTAETAAQIRALVWPKRLQKAYAETPGFYEQCACEYGRSGHCDADRHGQCRSYAGGRPVSTETYILSRAGHVAIMPGADAEYARVWLADRRCFWRCSCTCHTAAFPPGKGRPGQLDLFDLLAVAS